MTKEQLISENGALRDNVQTWSNKDATTRKQFARVLGQLTREYGYSNETPKDLSWNEIFCEVGKLLTRTQYQDWKQLVDSRLDDINQRLSQFDDPTRHVK